MTRSSHPRATKVERVKDQTKEKGKEECLGNSPDKDEPQSHKMKGVLGPAALGPSTRPCRGTNSATEGEGGGEYEDYRCIP